MTHTLPASPAALAARQDEPTDPAALVVAAVLFAPHAVPAVRTKGTGWDESGRDRGHGKFGSHPGATRGRPVRAGDRFRPGVEAAA